MRRTLSEHTNVANDPCINNRAILDGLKKVGFKYKLGAGLLYNAMTRGGGYYLGGTSCH